MEIDLFSFHCIKKPIFAMRFSSIDACVCENSRRIIVEPDWSSKRVLGILHCEMTRLRNEIRHRVASSWRFSLKNDQKHWKENEKKNYLPWTRQPNHFDAYLLFRLWFSIIFCKQNFSFFRSFNSKKRKRVSDEKLLYDF